MAEQRVPRELSTRQQSERVQTWRPPELLPEPDKQPGFGYRWIRVATNGQADARNISAKFREGYEAVDLSEQPKFAMLADPTSRFAGKIEIGGLLLCKIPEELIVQRDEYYAKQTQAQTEAVDNSFMRQSDSRMPLFRESKSTSSVGR